METLGKIFWGTVLVSGTLFVAQAAISAGKNLVMITRKAIEEIKEKGD